MTGQREKRRRPSPIDEAEHDYLTVLGSVRDDWPLPPGDVLASEDRMYDVNLFRHEPEVLLAAVLRVRARREWGRLPGRGRRRR
jgi:hypothetical protein